MASTYSPNLALELIGTGDQAGTWGNTTNTNLGTLIEQAISGYDVQTLTAGTTLTLTIPNGSTGVARNMYLEFTGNGSTVIVPSNKKLYFVYNNCTSGTITFKVAGGTGVSIPKGDKQILVSDGTDIVKATTYVDSSSATITDAYITNCYINTDTNFVATGKLFVKSTSSGTAAGFKQELSSADNVAFFWNNGTTGDNNFLAFATETSYTVRGRLDYLRGSGTVALVNVSDRRAKTMYGPYTTSGQEIDAIPIYNGRMNYGSIDRPLLIADELQQVAPYAVTGEPNAVYPDGSPKYQGVDYAVLIPLLIAEIQSLRTRVAALEQE
jgi:hypothetical protein